MTKSSGASIPLFMQVGRWVVRKLHVVQPHGIFLRGDDVSALVHPSPAMQISLAVLLFAFRSLDKSEPGSGRSGTPSWLEISVQALQFELIPAQSVAELRILIMPGSPISTASSEKEH